MRHPDQEGSGCWQTRSFRKSCRKAPSSVSRCARGRRCSPLGEEQYYASYGRLRVTMIKTTRRQDLIGQAAVRQQWRAAASCRDHAKAIAGPSLGALTLRCSPVSKAYLSRPICSNKPSNATTAIAPPRSSSKRSASKAMTSRTIACRRTGRLIASCAPASSASGCRRRHDI